MAMSIEQTRRLRIVADGDASGYVNARIAMAAADKAAAASGREIEATIVSVSQRINQAGDPFSRLARQYVDGARESQAFASNLAKLGSALERGQGSVSQAAQIIEGMSRKLGVTADATQVASAGFLSLSRAVEMASGNLESHRASVDDLTASYRQMQAEAKAAYAAEQSQGSFNRQLNVRPITSGAAAASASVFSEHLDRSDEIARLRSLQQGQNFASDLNQRLGIRSSTGNARESAAVFEEAARQADAMAAKAAALRDELDPVGASQARLNAKLEEYQKFAANSLITTEQLTKAETAARASHDQYVKSLNQDAEGGHGSSKFGLGPTQGQALFHAGRSTAEQLAIGIPPTQALAGQMNHLSYALVGEDGLISALSSLPALTLGIGAAVTAALVGVGAYFFSTREKVKSLSDAMKDQEDVLKRISTAYGDIAEKAAKASAPENLNLLSALSKRSSAALSVAEKAEATDYFGNPKIGGARSAGRYGERTAGYQAAAPEFQEPLAKLRAELKNGKADFDAFYDAIARKVQVNPALAKAANEAIALSDNLKQANDELERTRRIELALQGGNQRGFIVNSPGQDAYNDYTSSEAANLVSGQMEFQARIASIRAKTDAERIASAKQSAEAQRNQAETGPEYQQRVSQSEELARVQIEQAAKDALDQRKRSLDELLKSQQFDIDLIGKTGSQVAASREEYQRMAALREYAAQKGITGEDNIRRVFAAEILDIRKTAAEYGNLAEERAKTQLRNDLAFTHDQLGRSPEQRSIAEQLRSSGLPLNFNSQEAKDIAQSLREASNDNMKHSREAFAAQIQSLNARTPDERVAAARTTAAAQYNPRELPDEKQLRVSQAGMLERARINKNLADAESQRESSLQDLLDQQRQDIDLIGKTGAAAEAARQQFSLMHQLRSEADKQGIDDEKEFQKTYASQIEVIKQVSTQYGQLVEKRSKAQLNHDLSFEREQLFRSSGDQQIASRQQSAGLSVDLQSSEAQAIRNNMQLSAMKDTVKGFFTDFQSELVKNGGKAGEAFGTALRTSLMNSLSKIGEGAIDKLSNFVVHALTGQGPGSSPNAVMGGLLGGVGKVFGTNANDNKASVSTAVGSALSLGGNYKSGVDPRLTDILNTAATKFPGYGVSAISGLRPGDSRFHGQGLATDVQLTDLASGKVMSNYQDASTFSLYERFAQQARQVQLDKYPELTDRFRWGGYFSGAPGKYGALDEMHFDLGGNKVGMAGGSWANGLTPAQAAYFPGIQSKGMNDASDALTKLAGSAGQASQGIGSLGSGVSQLATSLTGSANRSGGSLLSELSSPNFTPNTTLGAVIGAPNAGQAQQSSSGLGIFGSMLSFIPKLFHFAEGTSSSPGGLAVVGERGRELVNLPRGSQVVPTHRTESLLAAAANSNSGGGRTKVDVGVSVDNNGNLQAYVKKVADDRATEKVRGSLADYTDHMRQQGFGQIQTNYMAEKG